VSAPAPDLPRAPARATVRVPASTSNLGAGFDAVGVALDRWLVAEATVVPGPDAPPHVERAGEAAALAGLAPHDDLLVRGFHHACAAAGRAAPAALRLRVDSDVPIARGLGSSAAALCAGALLADALLGLGFGPRGVAALVATVEGHPDNAAPACLGGAVLGVPDDASGSGGWAFAALDLHPDLAFALAVPGFGCSTEAMRRALPASVPHRDAVRAAGKAAALARGLATADPGLLAWALDDVLHVPHRRALVPHYDRVCDAARAAGAWGATLSGAGSALLALAPRALAPAVAAAMAAAWREAGIDAAGSTPAVAAGASAARDPGGDAGGTR
jgi:homoserine kinase